MKTSKYTIGLLIATILSIGCVQQSTTGDLVVQITDAPTELNIEKALVTISNVQVHIAEEENNTTTTDSWITILNQSKTYDLIQIRNVKEFLGTATLDPGKYTQVRLDVEKAIITINGTEHDLRIPSKKVKLVTGFIIKQNKTTTITIDFDAQKSIHKTGTNQYIMKPTIKIIDETLKACTKDYRPVCAVDGTTYPNKCTAGQIDILHQGECEEGLHTCTRDEKKAEICTMDYTPVCGNDNETYGNACMACASKIKYWTPGECN